MVFSDEDDDDGGGGKGCCGGGAGGKMMGAFELDNALAVSFALIMADSGNGGTGGNGDFGGGGCEGSRCCVQAMRLKNSPSLSRTEESRAPMAVESGIA